MGRFVALLYGVVSYVLFLASFLYAIGFMGNMVVPKGIDDGMAQPLAMALLINAALLGLFAVQHSIMARRWFKKWWTTIVPQAVERSTFVLITSLILFLIYWKWVPLTDTVWSIQDETWRMVVQVGFWLGWGIVLVSTFLIDHFDLFGLRQVWLYFNKKPYEAPKFMVIMFYKFVRHPLYVGFILAFWATPDMTQGHLVFSAATTAYMLLAILFEERDLIAFHGEDYKNYRKQVSMIIPFMKGMHKDS